MRQTGHTALLIMIGILNSLAVISLYLPQVVLPSVFPDIVDRQGWLPITAVFLGYCIGNANTAFNLVPLISRHPRNHLVLLSLALLLTGAAPTMLSFTGACFLTGVGASVAQRLLGMAAHLAGPRRAGNGVAGCIAAALLGVLGLRVWGEQLAAALGWRTMFVLMSVPFISCSCLLDGRSSYPDARLAATLDKPLDAIRLILSSVVLRRSMAHQAMVFASYNASWVLLAAQLGPNERATASFWGAFSGIACVLAAGTLVDVARIPWLHRLGNAAMFVPGCPLLLLAYAAFENAAGHPGLRSCVPLSLGMALIDGGMQLTLVTNQTRVQAIAPASRGRLSSLLTISGSLGGAFGGGLSRSLWQEHGWEAALALVAATAAGGLFVSCSSIRTPNCVQKGKHRRQVMRPAGFALSNQTTALALRCAADRDPRGKVTNQRSN